ncbi:AI-2E family transporter [Planctomyces sp. SH-PL62]|uniref:AI-2E family transporter n=1 Tax=Planctomyces sp. SH-PL62 TaxID=1636152 RepID=UPI00078E5C5D|nr:AI-2E family transporter [Planctomyces sp. SH-PL62]AMV39150.1 AI-2 transport protein TqsA [Planctomyces sp. SH-PL62]
MDVRPGEFRESTPPTIEPPGTPPPVDEGLPPDLEAAGSILGRASELGGSRTLAFVLIIVATSLYLLERLEPVLRPLLIAILLCYLFLPFYNRLRRRVRPVVAFLIITIGFTIGTLGLGRMIYHDIVSIDQGRLRYQEREAELEKAARKAMAAFTPAFAIRPAGPEDVAATDSLTNEMAERIVRGAASAFLSIGLESLVIAFYMIFLLQSASTLPSRISSSFSSDRAERILSIVESINRAISEYLLVKVKASLLVALPVGALCLGFGVTGAATWAVLTFFGNFLPYIGPLASVIPPLAIALLEFPTIWAPLAFAVILLTIHGVTANLIEPAMTGKALGLNPLVVLVGLAFWSLLWGFVGLVLAVPLTVIFKIILEHTPATRPIARLISEQNLS